MVAKEQKYKVKLIYCLYNVKVQVYVYVYIRCHILTFRNEIV